MNRAWIPAGALAGVSVAGLIALGQLTDSLGAPVTFDSSVALPPVNVQHTSKPVSVKIDRGAVGSTSTSAALNIDRGGPASAANPILSGDSGSVGYRIARASSSSAHSRPNAGTGLAGSPTPAITFPTAHGGR